MADLGEWVRVDPDGARPLFDQLRTQIIDGVRDGRLPPGTRLPTVRELAGQLNMAVNTVARAYRELEAAGMLETRGQIRHFRRTGGSRRRRDGDRGAHYVSAAKALGVGKADALRYVEAAFD